MSVKYVFLDRDGVINKDPYGWTPHSYVTRPEDFLFLPGVFEAMRKFKESGFKCVMISNQQGVGKGHFTREDLDKVTEKMTEEIKAAGGEVDSVYYCTHLTEEECPCKKPKPGMFIRAMEKYGIKDLSGMYYVGDTERDVQAGKEAGLATILVLSGKSSREDAQKWDFKPDHIFNNLLEAAEFIIKGDR